MIKAGDVGAPEHLAAHHDLDAFDSGEPSLDDWLRRRALGNEESGASRTYVVCARRRVVGYYALATGAVVRAEAEGGIRRNMPDPVPMMVLGRLAVDCEYQRGGVGAALLRDAVLRTLQAAQIGGIRGILVHAISDDAKHVYERNGFAASPINPMTLMISVSAAQRLLGEDEG